jgi:phosphatidate cytidylyltransferase
MNTTLKRLLAAMVGLAILIPTIVFIDPWGVDAIVAIAVVLCLYEYTGMAFPERRWTALIWLAVPCLLLQASVLFGTATSVAGVSALAPLWLILGVLFRKDLDVSTSGDAVARMILGWVYCGALMVFPGLIRRMDDGLAWIFVLMGVTWLGDTGAYFFGRWLGKHKLYEAVSPKKTWEGALGGGLVAVAGVAVIKLIAMQFGALEDFAWWEVVLIGVVVDALGVVGDLAESLFKRSFGVKDSGSILPGHGGLLDRIDGLLFTGPVLWVYLVALRPLWS